MLAWTAESVIVNHNPTREVKQMSWTDERGNRCTGYRPVLVYYPDHDERYKHLPEWARAQFPDEVKFSREDDPIKREKNYDDLTLEDTRRYSVKYPVTPVYWDSLLGKDIPIREGFMRI